MPVTFNFLNPPRPMAETIKRFGIIVNDPGVEFRYSNFGYGIIDYIISQVSKKDFASFMKSEVFEPLGMAHTSVLFDAAAEGNVVRLYDGKGNPVPYWDSDHRGASAVYSCAHDLVRFGMFHLKNHLSDQQRILTDKTIDSMVLPPDDKIVYHDPAIKWYGLGWTIMDIEGERLVSHSGAPGTTTRLTLAPRKNIAIALLCNNEIYASSYDLWDIEWAILAALIPDLPKTPNVPENEPGKYSPPPALLGEWSGLIKTTGGDVPVKMNFKEDGNVTLDINGKTITPITIENPLGKIRFNGGIFEGPFFGQIDTEEAKQSFHVLYLRLKLRENKLNGFLGAIAVNRSFCFPYWIELDRVSGTAAK